VLSRVVKRHFDIYSDHRENLHRSRSVAAAYCRIDSWNSTRRWSASLVFTVSMYQLQRFDIQQMVTSVDITLVEAHCS